MICAIGVLPDGTEKDYAIKYLKEHPETKNRLLLKRIQLGVAFR
jgi:hypothetical protein